MRETLASFLAQSSPAAVLVEIEAVKGSSPREAGTFMLVSGNGLWETVGGGQFEYMAINHARAMLEGKTSVETLDIPLGPEIGQCCGGRTLLRFTKVTQAVADALSARLKQAEEKQPSVFIFGAGHVGKALAQALLLLPFSISVIETRRAELDGLPEDVAARLTPMPEAMVKDIPPGGAAIIVTHDHALDFLIAREALARDDLSYVGMIGSKTKRATFANWLSREGSTECLEKLILPIGGNRVKDKRPAVIAALVAAEVLLAVHRFAARLAARSGLGHP